MKRLNATSSACRTFGEDLPACRASRLLVNFLWVIPVHPHTNSRALVITKRKASGQPPISTFSLLTVYADSDSAFVENWSEGTVGKCQARKCQGYLCRCNRHNSTARFFAACMQCFHRCIGRQERFRAHGSWLLVAIVMSLNGIKSWKPYCSCARPRQINLSI